jgi:hypothetical protein
LLTVPRPRHSQKSYGEKRYDTNTLQRCIEANRAPPNIPLKADQTCEPLASQRHCPDRDRAEDRILKT